MNRIYRLVWNHALCVLQVVSEFAHCPRAGADKARGSTKSMLQTALALALAAAITALPSRAHAQSTASGGDGTGSSPTAKSTMVGGSGGSAGVNGPTAGSGYRAGAAASTAGANGGNATNVTVFNAGAGGGGGGGNGGTSLGSAALTGGNGGSGAYNNYGGAGGGGAGGFGAVLVGAGGTLANQAAIAGGTGGTGGNGGWGGGGGGGGGTGLYVSTNSSGTSLTLSATVKGGAGGLGGVSSGGGYGVASGAGGNSSGAGGTSVTGNGGSSGGSGGGGGAGVSFVSSASGATTVVNNAVITGGNGGNGGSDGGDNGTGGGNAGGGGTGVSLSGAQITLTNAGSISGGHGGAGGACNYYCTGSAGRSGSGGAGVTADGSDTLITSSSISGGLSGDGFTRADAVDLSGGGNTLALRAGYSFVGNVISTSGSTNGGDTLALDGSGTFNASAIVSNQPASYYGATLYYGFSTYEKTGNGTWTLTGAGNSNVNWIVTGGTMQADATALGGDVTFSPAVGKTTTVVFDQGSGNVNSPATKTYTGTISGNGSLTKIDDGTLVLTGLNTYTGGTTISAGTLQIGDGGTAGSITGNVTDNGSLAFDRSDAVNFAGALSGTGTLTQNGSGTLTLDGNSSGFAGSTTVVAGTLVVGSTAGNGATLGGNVTVHAGAMLRGHGSIGGNVDVQSGGIVTPGDSIGTLTVSGDFTATQGSLMDFAFGAPGANFQTAGTGDSVTVGGNLTLDGATLNVTDAGSMGPGLYKVFSYGGTLTETHGGIALGTTPSGQTLFLQNLTAQKQINLIDTTGYTVEAWNANGLATSTRMGGGSGTWSTRSQVWTDATGTVPNGPMSPQPSFAVFGGAPGTVTVDDSAGSVSATGLQFATNGYALGGGTLTLVANGGVAPVIRVGDGSSAGTGMTATIHSVIAGSAGLTKADFGTLVLTGTNTYTGGTTINAGTLQIGDGSTAGSITGNVTDNGTLVLDRSDAVTFAGVVSGSGSLVQNGSGTLTLAGANTYAGGTTIRAGTLVVDSTTLPGAVTDHAALVFDQAGDGTFKGAISGNGSFAKTGAGTLILDGDSGAFAGSTSVQSGTLEVGDAGTPSAALGGNVTVVSGGTLRGHGMIGGDVSNSGTVWAGGSIGTLTIRGNYTQSASGVFKVEATPNGQASLLSIGGTATLAGTALVLANTGTWAPRTDYTVLTAAGGISGQFASASVNLPFLTPVLSYATNAVTLSLERNDINFNAVAQTQNQRAVATAANSLGVGNPTYDALVVLDAPTARHAFDQLSGEIHVSTRTAIADDDHYVRDAINRHLAGQHNDANGLNVTGASGVTTWTSVWGHRGSHDGDGNAADLATDGSGFLVGADLPVGATARLGAVLGTGQGSARIATRGASSHIVDQHLGVYGSLQSGALRWQSAAIYGWQKVDTNRFVGFGTFSGSAISSYHAHTAQAYVDTSLPFVHDSVTLAPFANLAVEQLSMPAITEHGTPAALNVAPQDSTLGYGTLGLRAALDLGAPDHRLHAHASLGWQHTWGDTLPVGTMRFESGSDSFAIAGLPVAKNEGVLTAGISFTIAPNVAVDGSYQGQFGHYVRDQSARISLDWTF